MLHWKTASFLSIFVFMPIRHGRNRLFGKWPWSFAVSHVWKYLYVAMIVIALLIHV